MYNRTGNCNSRRPPSHVMFMVGWVAFAFLRCHWKSFYYTTEIFAFLHCLFATERTVSSNRRRASMEWIINDQMPKSIAITEGCNVDNTEPSTQAVFLFHHSTARAHIGSGYHTIMAGVSVVGVRRYIVGTRKCLQKSIAIVVEVRKVRTYQEKPIVYNIRIAARAKKGWQVFTNGHIISYRCAVGKKRNHRWNATLAPTR